MIPLEKFTTLQIAGFEYHTFFCVVDIEFQPALNDEHLGYAWIDSGTWPKPMHPGLWSTVNFEAVQNKISVSNLQYSNVTIANEISIGHDPDVLAQLAQTSGMRVCSPIK
jgi:hypothetical protein